MKINIEYLQFANIRLHFILMHHQTS